MSTEQPRSGLWKPIPRTPGKVIAPVIIHGAKAVTIQEVIDAGNTEQDALPKVEEPKNPSQP